MRGKLLVVVCLAVSLSAAIGAFWYWDAFLREEVVALEPLPSPEVSRTTVVVPVGGEEPSMTVQTDDKPKLPDNPRGEPKQLIIYHGDKAIVSMKFGRAVYEPGGWSSKCGEVAYRDIGKWSKPGHLNERISLVTGHVWCDRETYPLIGLIDVVAGDRLEIHYTSGDVVLGTARDAADQIPKSELNAEAGDKRNPRLYNKSRARVVRVSTCDVESPKRSDFHLSGSVYALFDIDEIRYVLQERK